MTEIDSLTVPFSVRAINWHGVSYKAPPAIHAPPTLLSWSVARGRALVLSDAEHVAGMGGLLLSALVGALRTTAAPVLTSPLVRSGSRGAGVAKECYLVDPASSHMLVSKIKPCMCKYELIQTVKLRMAH
jgi:hypothetical protein